VIILHGIQLNLKELIELAEDRALSPWNFPQFNLVSTSRYAPPQLVSLTHQTAPDPTELTQSDKSKLNYPEIVPLGCHTPACSLPSLPATINM
jgi:hypothetical protein